MCGSYCLRADHCSWLGWTFKSSHKAITSHPIDKWSWECCKSHCVFFIFLWAHIFCSIIPCELEKKITIFWKNDGSYKKKATILKLENYGKVERKGTAELGICISLYWRERLKTEEEGDRGWDGWMASLIQWTWTWANSGRWWGTRKPGVPQSMGSQRVGHDLATEQQQHLIKVHVARNQWVFFPMRIYLFFHFMCVMGTFDDTHIT